MSKLFILIPILVLFLGCDEYLHHKHEDQSDKSKHNEHVEMEPIALTHYTDKTELFVEFEPFVLNEPSTFLAHFTTISDFKPIDKAKVEACLDYIGGKKECFSIDGVKTSGIFRPVAIPKQTGKAELSISIEMEEEEEETVTHRLGSFNVHASLKDVGHVEHEENATEISYLKEQQWKVDFATELASKRPLHYATPSFVEVQIPSNAKQFVSAPVSGVVIVASHITTGSSVKAGDKVAYIIPSLAQSEDIATLQFELTKAEAELKLTKNESERLQKLYTQDAVPLKRLEESQQNYEIAKASLKKINKKLQGLSSGKNGNGVSLKSYIDGNIIDIEAFNGTYVQEGEIIMQIADISKLWLKANISQHEVASIGKPIGVELLQTQGSLSFTTNNSAKLLYFSSLIDPKTRTAKVVFEIDNKNIQIKPGSRYSAKVYSDKSREVVAIAKSSIISDNGENVVFVQNGGESFERRLVEVGDTDSMYVEIRSGIEAGERVVTKGAYRLMLSSLAPAAVGHGHAH
ncbi:efflux RND transporter periplasmic adaptor subunit [bacterium]|nr:efflux RND transporter periplasmic adaptor subunit [bacterium]